MEWTGVGEALVRSMLVVEVLELPERVEQVALVPNQDPIEEFSPQVSGQHPGRADHPLPDAAAPTRRP
jgi:hypothetical protein